MCWGMGKTVQQDCTGKTRNIKVMAKDKGSVGVQDTKLWEAWLHDFCGLE